MNTPEISKVPDEIRQELAKQSITETMLKEMEVHCLSLVLSSPNDKEGYKVIYDNYQKTVKTRTTIEKTYDAARAELTRKSKLNLTDKAEMVKLITPSEEHLLAQRKIYEDEQDRIKQEAIHKMELEEAAKKQKIQDRTTALSKIPAMLEDGMYIVATSHGLYDEIMNCSDERFTEYLKEFQAAKDKQVEDTAKIQRRKDAILKTGAIVYHDGESDQPGYLLGEITIGEFFALSCEEPEFHQLLRSFSVEAEKIKMAKEKAEAELAAREKLITRKEELSKAGAILGTDGIYRLGEAIIDSPGIVSFTDKEFEFAITLFKAEKVLIISREKAACEAKEREEKEKAEAEKNKVIAKGEKRFKELEKYGLSMQGSKFTREEEVLKLGEKTEEHYIILRDDWIKVADDNKKIEAERKAALAPDLIKLQTFVKTLKAIKVPACSTDEGKRIITEFAGSFKDSIADFQTRIKKLVNG